MRKLKVKDNENYALLYNAGVEEFNCNNYRDAYKAFKLATLDKACRSKVYQGLAKCCVCLGNYSEAIKAYKVYLEKHSNDSKAWFDMANIYYQAENYPKAAAYYEKSFYLKKTDMALEEFIMSQSLANRQNIAKNFAENLLENDENGEYWYYKIAKVFETKNSYTRDSSCMDVAIGMYLKLIERNDVYFEAYFSAAICLAKQGQWHRAIKYFDNALKINPESYVANAQMGLMHYCLGDLRNAIDYYEKALTLDDSDYRIYMNLGYAYEKLGLLEKAKKYFAKLLELYPDIPAHCEVKFHAMHIQNS